MSPLAETLMLLVIAVGLHSTRLSWPLRWAETFYHEMSHGIACILTGGKVISLRLDWRGSGACTFRGGWRFPILLAGYMGASLWGAVLFLIGLYLNDESIRWWLWLELALLGLTLLFWARSISTLMILILIGSVYLAALWLPPQYGLHYVLQVMGLFVMLNALGAPFHLIDGQHVGDGADLANLTRIIPEGLWVAWWVLFAAVVLGWCLWLKAFGTPLFAVGAGLLGRVLG
ncbi:MAG: M50 family metallopeptidase [Pseudomonadota bacterium]